MESPAHPLVEQGLALHQAGKVTEAEALYRQALAKDPNHAGALHLLGVAASQQGRKLEAADLISRAIAITPNIADFHVNLALVWIELGSPLKAIPLCQKAMQLAPNHADAYNHMGVALSQISRPDQAMLYLRKALELRENHTDALANLGALYQQMGRFEDAAVMFERLIRVQGPRAEVWQVLGDIYRELKRLPESENAYRQAIGINANSAEGHAGLALLLHERGDIDASMPLYDKAISLKHEFVTCLSNFGLALVARGDVQGGIERYNEALRARPDFANALNNLGNAYRELLDMTNCRACYDRALFFQPDHPDAHWNRSLLRLLMGEFAAGWHEYEWRWIKFPQERRNFGQARWDGDFDIRGKSILLYAEQGFGDTIQFARFIPMVAALGATVVVECQPELKRLLSTVPGISQLLERGEVIPQTDFQCAMMSLGHAFKIDASNLPNKVPYVKADESQVKSWAKKLEPYAGTLKIGVTWAGAARHHRDRERSMRRGKFTALAQLPGVTLFSLQKGPPAAEPAEGATMVDFTAELNDFADSAALLENLDMVISVDTAIVHLAGALGKTVWTLVPHLPDWRWMLERENTHWYPTMRLLRQWERTSWDKTLDTMVADVRALAAAKR